MVMHHCFNKNKNFLSYYFEMSDLDHIFDQLVKPFVLFFKLNLMVKT